MNTTEYYVKFWNTKLELESNGVKQIVSEMQKVGVLDHSQDYNNELLGRKKNEAFLRKLIYFNSVVKKANSSLQMSQKDIDLLEDLIESHSSSKKEFKHIKEYINQFLIK